MGLENRGAKETQDSYITYKKGLSTKLLLKPARNTS